MKDLSLPNYTSAKIADRILEGKITFKQIQKAVQFDEIIKPRLEALIHLKNSLYSSLFISKYFIYILPLYIINTF